MKKRLTVFLYTAVAGAYANASEVVMMEPLTVSGEAEERAGYSHQFEQSTEVGSRLGIAVKETPASVEIINSQTMEQRGDTTVIP